MKILTAFDNSPIALDHIYEAAFTPDFWPGVLGDIAAASSSVSGSFLVISNQQRPPRYRATRLTDAALNRHVTSQEWRTSETAAACFSGAAAAALTGFTYIRDVLEPEAVMRDTVSQSLFELGLDAQISTLIPLSTGEISTFTFERRKGEGKHSSRAIALLDALRPHLARAGLIAARLELQQAQTMVATLDRLGLPAAVLKSGGLVLAANTAFEALDTVFIARAFGGVSIADRSSNVLLQSAIEDMQRRDLPPLVASIPIASEAGLPPYVVHVVPLRRSAKDIFASADILLVVNQVGASAGVPSNALVMALFDLSPAEARLALRLAAGLSLTAAGRDCGLSIASARTYLARIFSKTGTHSQHQLVALLRSAKSMGETPA